MIVDALKYQYIDELYENIAVLNTDTSTLQHNVYLAVNRVTRKAVIKKIIGIDIVPIYMQLKNISNPHLATIYDCAQNGWNGIVIEEYIEGMTLENYIQNKGRLSEKEACKIITDLCDALEPIHKAGLIHRDINPKNIMISNDNVLKLIDFGIARRHRENSSHDTTFLGTLGYIPPEQLGYSQTDARTDIYALGILLNELLTGKLPNECLYQKPKLKKIIQKCIQIDPRKRFQSVSTLKKKLHKGVLSWIPGFRKGNVIHGILAVFGYWVFFDYSQIKLDLCTSNPVAFLLEILALFLYLWGNTFLALNVADWDEKLFLIRKFPPKVKLALRIVLWFYFFYIGITLEEYVMYDILGLPPLSTYRTLESNYVSIYVTILPTAKLFLNNHYFVG